MRRDGLLFFESIGKCCGGGIVDAIDICELDVTILLKFTGSERRTNDRDAPQETELSVDIADPYGQALFTGFSGRIDIFSFNMVPNPV